MRKYILLLLLISSITAVAQTDTTHPSTHEDSISIIHTPAIDTSVITAPSPIDIDQSVNYFLQLEKERKAKAKKEAIVRIAIGLGFLVILFIGWRRRTVKK